MAEGLERKRHGKNGSSGALHHTQLELERARREVLASAQQLRSDVRALTDWRKPLRARPWATVGAGFALGFLIALTRRRGDL